MAEKAQPRLAKAKPSEVDEETHEILIKEQFTAKWMIEQMKQEIARIKSQGANALPLSIKNTGVIREGEKVINRVVRSLVHFKGCQEIDTGFDFSLVERILISDAIVCPFKEGYKYINVLLFTAQPLPLILPYVYEATADNTLKHWMFINARFEKVRHKVKSFRDVQ